MFSIPKEWHIYRNIHRQEECDPEGVEYPLFDIFYKYVTPSGYYPIHASWGNRLEVCFPCFPSRRDDIFIETSVGKRNATPKGSNIHV